MPPQFMAVVAGEPNVDDVDVDEDMMEEDEEPDTVEEAALKQLEKSKKKITPLLLGPDGKPLAHADEEALTEFKEHIEELFKNRSDRLEESAEQEEKIRLGEEGWKSRWAASSAVGYLDCLAV